MGNTDDQDDAMTLPIIVSLLTILALISLIVFIYMIGGISKIKCSCCSCCCRWQCRCFKWEKTKVGKNSRDEGMQRCLAAALEKAHMENARLRGELEYVGAYPAEEYYEDDEEVDGCGDAGGIAMVSPEEVQRARERQAEIAGSDASFSRYIPTGQPLPQPPQVQATRPSPAPKPRAALLKPPSRSANYGPVAPR